MAPKEKLTRGGVDSNPASGKSRRTWFSKVFFSSSRNDEKSRRVEDDDEDLARPEKWSMGVLNDPYTHEVPGMTITTPVN